MKIIDLLNKIANGELEDLTHIRNIQHDCEYIYHKKDCRFEFVKKGIWENYFYKFDISELNDEIEIIEEEKKIESPEELKKEIHKFAYECAVKGVDIEETINSIAKNYGEIINSITKNYGEIINAIIKLEEKNYNYLLKFAKIEESETDLDKVLEYYGLSDYSAMTNEQKEDSIKNFDKKIARKRKENGE